MSSAIWTPGMAGPHEAFVERLERRIESFAERRGWERAYVELEFVDGVVVSLFSISAEPGFGFITVCPYPEDEEQPWPSRDDEAQVPPGEMIVPIGSIKRITLGEPEARGHRFGFAPPSA
jgi:hypothetical protein